MKIKTAKRKFGLQENEWKQDDSMKKMKQNGTHTDREIEGECKDDA